MEIITIESSAYKELVEKIDKIAGYVRENERAKKKDAPDVWLCNEEVMSLLGISRRTLQRLRENGRIGYVIFRGACRYPFAELERLIEESTFNCNPQTLEEFKRNYLLRTGGKPSLQLNNKCPQYAGDNYQEGKGKYSQYADDNHQEGKEEYPQQPEGNHPAITKNGKPSGVPPLKK